MVIEPSICWRMPSGFSVSPWSSANTTRFTRTRPVVLSTATSAMLATRVFGVDPAGHAHAAAAGRLGRLPAELGGGRLEHAPQARVGEVIQPELQRVLTGLGRQDVHVRFARERVACWPTGRARDPRRTGACRAGCRPASPRQNVVRWLGMS